MYPNSKTSQTNLAKPPLLYPTLRLAPWKSKAYSISTILMFPNWCKSVEPDKCTTWLLLGVKHPKINLARWRTSKTNLATARCRTFKKATWLLPGVEPPKPTWLQLGVEPPKTNLALILSYFPPLARVCALTALWQLAVTLRLCNTKTWPWPVTSC